MTDGDSQSPRTLMVLAASLCIFAIVLVAGLSAGRVLDRFREPTAVATVGSVPKGAAAPPPGETEHVEVTMRSEDVPGCFAQGEPFSAHVESHWRDKVANIDLDFSWAPAEGAVPGKGQILVRASGQSKRVRLDAGEEMLPLELTLPVEPAPLVMKLTTFRFERWGPGLEACFVWINPPGVPRPEPAIRITPDTA